MAAMSTTEQARGGRVAPSKTEIDEARALSREVGLEYVDLDRYPLNAAAASLLPEQLARRHHALAVGWKYGTPVVAVAAPDNVLGMDDVRTVVGRDIHAVVACGSQIDAYIERMYNQSSGPVSARAAAPEAPPEVAAPTAPAPEAPAAAAPPPAPAHAPAHAPAAAPAPPKAAATPPPPPPPPAPAPAVPVLLSPPEAAAAPTPAPPAPTAAEAAAPPAPPAAETAPAPVTNAPAAEAATAEAAADAAAAEAAAKEAAADATAEAAAADAAAAAAVAAAEAAVALAPASPAAAPAPATRSFQTAATAPPPPAPPAPNAGGGAKTDRPPNFLPDDDAAEPVRRDAPLAREADERGGKPSDEPALAKVLLESGQVTPEEMQAALREASATGRKLGEILSELGLVTEEDLIRAMAEEVGLEFIDLNEFTIDLKALQSIPEAMARRHQVIAIGYRNGVPIIAMANPSNVFAMDDLRTVLGRDIVTVVSSPRQINDYVTRMYRHDKEASEAATKAAQNQTQLDTATEKLELTDLHAVVEDAPIVKYVNLILRQALQERASDVHIEPSADDLRIRFRIDGVLHDITRSPKAIQGGVTTRLKVMANLDIAEHRLPQDGRISLNAGNRAIDLRVATLPTVHGEKVVMRILDKSNAMMDLGDLGFLPEVETRYKESYRKPYGTILVTGPTGSGKSTTLYATLNVLNVAERNLITVEDPVEYQLPGVNQVQVNPKAGLTFASALRSILRSDPDIILVGEIRDTETAVIAIEAALTGHLVLSSLHTNDAAGTPMRLIEMGVEPFLVASALDCVVAQRLARQLCENCNEPHNPTPEELAVFGWDDADTPPQGRPRFRKAVGCQACSRTGYRGRIALHELLIVTEEIEKAVIHGTSADDIDRVAIEQGTVPLRHDGLRKAALGLTSLEEVIRVVA
jgi:type IV pilus assembly protein PilB